MFICAYQCMLLSTFFVPEYIGQLKKITYSVVFYLLNKMLWNSWPNNIYRLKIASNTSGLEIQPVKNQKLKSIDKMTITSVWVSNPSITPSEQKQCAPTKFRAGYFYSCNNLTKIYEYYIPNFFFLFQVVDTKNFCFVLEV